VSFFRAGTLNRHAIDFGHDGRRLEMDLRRIGRRSAVAFVAVGVTAGVVGAAAFGRPAAAPANTNPPTISGTAKEGSTLTTSNGTWTGAPTTFAYQWRRCATDGTACGDIAGATKSTYTAVAADEAHTLRSEVTASNADGKGTATSDPTDVVDSKDGPKNTVRPTVSGSARVGEELTVSNGTWTPTPTSYHRLWQRCDTSGGDCRNIAGATGRTYGVRSADVDHRLRALVTAITAAGASTIASSPSAVVGGNTSTVTTTTSTTVQGNRAPRLRFISLRWNGRSLYARFRVCDDDPGRIGMTARHNKARALPYTKHFTVALSLGCGTYTRHWAAPVRFRTSGLLVVQLRASDSGHRLSNLVRRSIRHS
jgi:hypothetical protein